MSSAVRGVMARAQIFALTSAYEGFPNAMLEAMALGVPIVATNVGGIPDVVSDGVHALLVSPGDVAAQCCHEHDLDIGTVSGRHAERAREGEDHDQPEEDLGQAVAGLENGTPPDLLAHAHGGLSPAA